MGDESKMKPRIYKAIADGLALLIVGLGLFGLLTVIIWIERIMHTPLW